MADLGGTISARLAQCAAVFEAADPPRQGRLAFWRPDGGAPPAQAGEPGKLTVALRTGGDVRLSVVPAVRLPLGEALPALLQAEREAGDRPAVHPAAAFWGTVAKAALHLVARGRIVPGLSPGGFDAWRASLAGPQDADRIRAMAAAMPVHAHAAPLPGAAGMDQPARAATSDRAGGAGIRLPAPEPLVRAFLDAVADAMPRTPAAELAAGAPLFAATGPQQAATLQEWAQEVAAVADAGVWISLRVERTHESGEASSAGRPQRGGQEADFGDLRIAVQVNSRSDAALFCDARDLWSDEPGQQQGAGFGPQSRIDTVLAVQRAARVWAPLGRLLDTAVPDGLYPTDEEIIELLSSASAQLAAADVDVLWPRDLLVRGLTATAVVGGDTPPSDLRSFLGANELLQFRWQLALDGEPLTGEEMDLLAEARRPIVRLRGHWVVIDPTLAAKARDRELKPLTALEALGATLTGTAQAGGEQVEVTPAAWLESLRARIAEPDGGTEPLCQPAALAGTLRDYQLRGLRWLERMTSLGLGGCLADDMGLGKTITVIALHLHRQEASQAPAASQPTLVVCPASLLGNWEREITRFAPGTPVRRYHAAERDVTGTGSGFVLTTYGTMRLDAARLAAVPWGMVIADEAQHVKNPLSATARALRQIPAGTRIALTGTPVENNLTELWAILDWTTPGLLGTLRVFRSRWARQAESGDAAAAHRLACLIRPFLLRRRKSDPGIAPELPAKTETDRPVALTREQAALYEAVVRETMTQIRQSDGIQRRGLILKLLTELKQICNHPAQFLKEAHPHLPGRSGKLELLDELVETITAEDGAVLVFTQYVVMARLLERHLAERGIVTRLLHGGTPVRRREELVESFERGDFPVFLLSLKAAGTGLNLIRADHVLHYDRWWNPAVEDQATDRAYRIGQTKPVQVHRLITEGTVEDRIATMLVSKKELADAVLTSGEAALTELSDSELADLVELRPQPLPRVTTGQGVTAGQGAR